MARDLTSGVVTEATASANRPCFLAYFDFQAGAQRVWSGIGSVTWGGNTYAGLGRLGSFTPIEETVDVRAAGMTFRLCGVDTTLVAAAMADNYHGRAVKLWLGFLNSSGAIIADPYSVFSGRMDLVQLDDSDPANPVLLINAESVLNDLRRSRERRYTHEDQQLDFPGDRGLEYMPTANSKPFAWGGQVYGNGNTGHVGEGTTIGPPR